MSLYQKCVSHMISHKIVINVELDLRMCGKIGYSKQLIEIIGQGLLGFR